MPAIQVTVEIAKDQVSTIESVLLAAAPEDEPPALSSFAVEPGEGWKIDAIFAEPPDLNALKVELEAAGVQKESLKVADVPPVDWVAESLKHHDVVRAGRFYVHGSHHAARPWSRYAIRIDAGMAFGTGQHETTLGCLRALDYLAKRRNIQRPLDLGCGTGVLAIATAKSWPCIVTASDIDPASTQITLENATRNGVGHRVDPITAVGLDHPALRTPQRFDLVTANILAQPLIDLAHDLVRALDDTGTLVLSGFLDHQQTRVSAAYRNRGLRLVQRYQIGDWITLVLAR